MICHQLNPTQTHDQTQLNDHANSFCFKLTQCPNIKFNQMKYEHSPN